MALALAGCSASGGSQSSVGHAPSGIAKQDSAGAASDPNTVLSDDREVVTTGSATITADNPLSAADKATRIVEASGGRVDDRSQEAATRTSGATASLTLRIPSSALTATLTRIKALGHVATIKMSAVDVTTKGQDLDARITALQTSVDRLLELESKATDSKTLIDFETAISSRQGDLDSLTAQRKTLSDQVSMSTLALSIVTPANAPVSHTASPLDALFAGLSGFSTVFTWLFLALSYLLPWIVLGGVVTVVVIAIVRWRRRVGEGTPSV
jgi:hypothetical protein